MDSLKQALARYGNSWSAEVPAAFVKACEPLQARQNQTYGDDIRAERDIKYGSDARHRIDVYTPAAGASGRPVVVFIHGGGLVAGDNNVTPNIYQNIGNYFTKRGCVTCLATYRLALQGGHHPDGAQDVASALKWVQANISRYGGDPAKVVAMGQSAGGYHLVTALFLGFLDADADADAAAAPPLLRGLVTLSAPFTTATDEPARAEALGDWFQTDKLFEINARYSPLAIFRQQYFGTATTAPRDAFPCDLLMLIGDYEADEILAGTWEFVADHRRRFGRLPVLEVMKGHNHVSYAFGLGLDDPDHERVGKRLLAYVRDVTQ